jgi:microcystin-dependent protein
MAQSFVGEIRMFGGNFAPLDWAFCNGQLMQISQFDALFNLIGTTYGGDGQTTFGLPDLQCRLPVHQNAANGAFVIGQKSGEENHILTLQEMPSHTHTVIGMGSGTGNGVAGNLYGGGGLAAFKSTTGASMNAQMVENNSGNQPHTNVMPFLAVSFIISLFGIFPSRS